MENKWTPRPYSLAALLVVRNKVEVRLHKFSLQLRETMYLPPFPLFEGDSPTYRKPATTVT
jgi:hypothetical protein